VENEVYLEGFRVEEEKVGEKCLFVGNRPTHIDQNNSNYIIRKTKTRSRV